MSKKERTFKHGDYYTRRRKAQERLGTDNPKCVYCDETEPVALHLHHIGQLKYDDKTIIVCLNHHARLSDAQKDHPPKIEGNNDPLEGFAHILLGIVDLLKIVIEQLVRASVFLLDRTRHAQSAKAT